MDSESNKNISMPSQWPTEGLKTEASAAFPSDLFERSVASTAEAYRKLGHTLGWRFLTGPKATLSPRTQIGLITLNPGGDHEPQEHPRASSEAGSAYQVESWPGYARGRSPLQFQIQAMLGSLARHLGDTAPLATFINDRVLSAQFIPFRSASLAALPRRRESIAFAQDLWRGILTHWQPRLLITIDTETFANLQKILLARPGARSQGHEQFPTGWGDCQAEAVRIARPSNAPIVTLARLPHLSRFALFGRAASRRPMEDFLRYLVA